MHSSQGQYAASDFSASRSGDARTYETNRHDDQRHVRRRSEATTPSTFDPAVYSTCALEPPDHFDADTHHRDFRGQQELGSQNGSFVHEVWQKRRRKWDGYKLLGGMMVQDGAASRWRINLADRQVLQRSAVNVVLIGLWYIFSLSISIVCPGLRYSYLMVLTRPSTTNGCSLLTILTSSFPYLPPARTCWFNFPWHPLSCSSSRTSDLAMTAS